MVAQNFPIISYSWVYVNYSKVYSSDAENRKRESMIFFLRELLCKLIISFCITLFALMT